MYLSTSAIQSESSILDQTNIKQITNQLNSPLNYTGIFHSRICNYEIFDIPNKVLGNNL